MQSFLKLLALLLIITGCHKTNTTLQDKTFTAVVSGREGTCYSWMIQFDKDLDEIKTIMGKDFSSNGKYGVIHLPEGIKIEGTSFTASIRRATETEVGKIVCNAMGVPPKWIVLYNISNVKFPMR